MKITSFLFLLSIFFLPSQPFLCMYTLSLTHTQTHAHMYAEYMGSQSLVTAGNSVRLEIILNAMDQFPKKSK